jgi:putative copper export protein
MHTTRTRNWYLTRQLLALGTGAILLVVALILLEPSTMGGSQRTLESPLVWAGILGMLFGLGWMVRIVRGTREDPPPWRHRDR